MPKSLPYSNGSIIYFYGDSAERVFLLQSGGVKLAYRDIETKQDVQEILAPGEFFGVKSALGHYPREENAIALQATVAVSFSVAEFEAVAVANGQLIMKMLKVFSNQMRRTHKQVASLMKESLPPAPEAGLFSVGEYYLKTKRYGYARRVFDQYLLTYPASKRAERAALNLQSAEAYIAKYGDGLVKERPAGRMDIEPPAELSLALPDTLDMGGSDVAKQYADAMILVSEEKYIPACQTLKKIADGDDAAYAAKSALEIGRCLFLMNKFNECIQYCTQMLTKYPKHPAFAEILFFMGQSHEKNEKGDRKDRALALYRKALSLLSDQDDPVYQKIQNALKALEVS
jgi:CRP-like cAMP-binding protein